MTRLPTTTVSKTVVGSLAVGDFCCVTHQYITRQGVSARVLVVQQEESMRNVPRLSISRIVRYRQIDVVVGALGGRTGVEKGVGVGVAIGDCALRGHKNFTTGSVHTGGVVEISIESGIQCKLEVNRLTRLARWIRFYRVGTVRVAGDVKVEAKKSARVGEIERIGTDCTVIEGDGIFGSIATITVYFESGELDLAVTVFASNSELSSLIVVQSSQFTLHAASGRIQSHVPCFDITRVSPSQFTRVTTAVGCGKNRTGLVVVNLDTDRVVVVTLRADSWA